MKKRYRKPVAVLGALAGVALLVSEVSRFHNTGPERWFWIVAGALLTLFAAAELFSGPRPGE